MIASDGEFPPLPESREEVPSECEARWYESEGRSPTPPAS